MHSLLLATVFIGLTNAVDPNPDFNNVANILSEFTSESVNNFLRNQTGGFGNDLCVKQLLWLSEALENREYWALNIFDSWGKVPAGLLVGNTNSYGSFDQCLRASHDSKSSEVKIIEGQHCNLRIRVAIPGDKENTTWKDLVLGTCVPSACDPDFLKQIVDAYLIQFGITTAPAYDQSEHCVQNRVEPLTGVDIFAIAFFSTIGLAIIGSTIYDIIMRQKQRAPRPDLAAFSIYTNTLQLLKTRKPDINKRFEIIDCLNGIRVLSITWIVFSHTYIMYRVTPLADYTSMLTWIENYSSMVVYASTVSVDSFLLLSGLLVAHGIFKELDKRRRLNVFLMYFHRYLRLTPALGVLILFTVSLLEYTGTGPLWKPYWKQSIEACQHYWWSSLLYIQNYNNPNEMCIGLTWYLSVDMQLYILSPLIIYPLWRWGRKVVPAIIALILISLSSVFTYFMVNELRLSYSFDQVDKLRLTYYPTHARMSPWLVGVILSYILHTSKGKTRRISMTYLILGWTLSLATFATVIFGYYPLGQFDISGNPLWADAVYETFSRICWAISLSWIIFVCVNGYGGFINTFLSLTFWQPLARLSYSIYLLHLSVHLYMVATIRQPTSFNNINAIHTFWGHFGFTVTLAFVWYVAFESPIIGIEKILFRRGEKTQSRINIVEEVEAASSGSTIFKKKIKLCT